MPNTVVKKQTKTSMTIIVRPDFINNQYEARKKRQF